MAETKSRNSRSSSQTSSRRKAGSSRSKNGTSSAKGAGSSRKASPSSKASGTSSRKRPATSRSKRSNTPRSRASPESTLSKVTSKAKGPALAGGAALVGLAGGIALNRNGSKRSGIMGRLPSPVSAASKLKLPKPKRPDIDSDAALKGIGRAAETVATRSRQVGDVAGQVQRASDAVRKAKG
jgi:hypothetical protein